MEEIDRENAVQFMLMVYLGKKPSGRISEGKFTPRYGELGSTIENRHHRAGVKVSSRAAPGRKALSRA
jgi:hypothetical protein